MNPGLYDHPLDVEYNIVTSAGDTRLEGLVLSTTKGFFTA